MSHGGRRLALVVATSRSADGALSELPAGLSDADALAGVLGDPDLGGFAVTRCLDRPKHEVEQAVESFCSDARADDLLLLYFSGHGLKDDGGQLYLAAANTSASRLRSTALQSGFVNDCMTDSPARRQVLILDCCFSGAFARDGRLSKGEPTADVDRQFRPPADAGRGRVVLAASNTLQHAFAGTDGRPSVFTRHLAEGLSSGAADGDGDGWVSVDELYAYAHGQVTRGGHKQTPNKWAFAVEGQLYLARSPRGPRTPPAAAAPPGGAKGPAALDLGAYRSALAQRYGTLSFESLDTTGTCYNRVRLWSVFVPQLARECHEFYPQLLELPKEHQRRLRERGGWAPAVPPEEAERRRLAYFEQTPRPVLEVLDDDRQGRTVVLGDPGAGKSALLRYLALRWAEGTPGPLPLLVELREYDRWECPSGKGLVRFLHEGQVWHRLDRDALGAVLREPGGALLMLDALDEVFDPARREGVVNDIHRLSNEYPNARVVVTSRVVGYSPQRLRDAGFGHYMLQDLEAEQVETFLTRWHELTFDDPAEGSSKLARLRKALNESRPVRELAGNPLLLTMMAVLGRNQELPRDRAGLYEQASRVLLHQWDVERSLESHPELRGLVGFPEKARMLRRVAHFMQGSGQGLAGNVIARDDLVRLLRDYLRDDLGVGEPQRAAQALAEQFRERTFVLCFLGSDSYAFIHRTFLEYFCAAEFVSRFEKERTLDFDGLMRETFDAHWAEEGWHEVLCLIAGMVDGRVVGQIIDRLLRQNDPTDEYRHVFLAARCFQEVRNPAPLAATQRALAEELLGLPRFPFDPDSYRQAEATSRLRAKVVSHLVGANLLPDPSAWLKERALVEHDSSVRSTALMELARGWPDDPDTVPILKRLATDKDVRWQALAELKRGWPDDPDTLLLFQRLAADRSAYVSVRREALTELARGWKDDPRALPILIGLADDEVWSVRQTALTELARGWKDDPGTLPLLKRLAAAKNSGVCLEALTELKRGWPDDPDTFPLLKRLAADEDSGVCLEALTELKRGWPDDPDTLPLLKRLAAAKDWFVRRKALMELARGWPDDPDTVPILKRLAADKDSGVRRAALIELARGWKDDPRTLPLLIALADDEDSYVRQAAVTELARGWKDDPAPSPCSSGSPTTRTNS